jgi:hypothetical protein
MPIFLYSSYITIKYSPDGDTLWTRAYRKSDLNSPRAMAVDASGNVYVTGRASYGYTELSGSYVGGHFATIKYSSAGDTLWTRVFTDAIGATALAVDSSGNVYVAGYALTNTGSIYEPIYHGSVVTVKYNSEGDTLWTRQYDGSWTSTQHPPEYKVTMCLDKNGNVYVAGSPSVPSDAAPGLVTVKYSSSGDELWTAFYPPGSAVVGIKLDASENVYIVCTDGRQTGPTRATVIKYVQSATSVRDLCGTIPASFALEQNYPNPFNPLTMICYSLPHRSHVALTVFNTLGQQVATLVNGEIEAGYHEVKFDAAGLASGVYLYRMQAGSYIATKKLLLIR